MASVVVGTSVIVSGLARTGIGVGSTAVIVAVGMGASVVDMVERKKERKV